MKRNLVGNVFLMIVVLMLGVMTQSGSALEKPVIYAEVFEDTLIYESETEEYDIVDNEAEIEQEINILPTAEARIIVWQPVDGAKGYVVTIRNVDDDVVVYEKVPQSHYWFDTTMILPQQKEPLLEWNVNYKMAVGAYSDDVNACDWSVPYYFRLEESIPTEIWGEFDDRKIEVELGDSAYVDGTVWSEGSEIVQVTYQIDGWNGYDENGRYCTEKIRATYEVDLDELDDLVIDTTEEPLNVPGEYTLKLVARTEDGTWAVLDTMTVVVTAPVVTEAPTKEPMELDGAFENGSVEIALGERAKVEGWAEAIGGNLSRITYQIEGWYGEDNNNRYCSQVVDGKDYVNLEDLDNLVLDTTSTPLNAAGEYTLKLVAMAEDGTWAHLDAMTVIVKAAEVVTEAPTVTVEITDEPTDEPTKAPIELGGYFAYDSIEIELGERTKVEGTVGSVGGNLSRITYQIEGWYGEDNNNRYCSQVIDGVNLVNLEDLDNLVLDTTNAPLNAAGEYTLKLVAMAEDGTWAHLDRMTVYVIGDMEHHSTGTPQYSEAGTVPPVITATPKPADLSTGVPQYSEPGTVPPVITATPIPVEDSEEKVSIRGYFDELSVVLRVGEQVRVTGKVGSKGDDLARITYQIGGWTTGDDNNRYCTQEVNSDYIVLENMENLILDANRAPLNQAGEYTLYLIAKTNNGTTERLDTMNVIVVDDSAEGEEVIQESNGAAKVISVSMLTKGVVTPGNMVVMEILCNETTSYLDVYDENNAGAAASYSTLMDPTVDQNGTRHFVYMTRFVENGNYQLRFVALNGDKQWSDDRGDWGYVDLLVCDHTLGEAAQVGEARYENSNLKEHKVITTQRQVCLCGQEEKVYEDAKMEAHDTNTGGLGFQGEHEEGKGHQYYRTCRCGHAKVNGQYRAYWSDCATCISLYGENALGKMAEYSEQVKEIQKRLVELDIIDESEVDGYFGEKTEEAVKTFQRNNGLEDTGVVDVGTQVILQKRDDIVETDEETIEQVEEGEKQYRVLFKDAIGFNSEVLASNKSYGPADTIFIDSNALSDVADIVKLNSKGFSGFLSKYVFEEVYSFFANPAETVTSKWSGEDEYEYLVEKIRIAVLETLMLTNSNVDIDDIMMDYDSEDARKVCSFIGDLTNAGSGTLDLLQASDNWFGNVDFIMNVIDVAEDGKLVLGQEQLPAFLKKLFGNTAATEFISKNQKAFKMGSIGLTVVGCMIEMGVELEEFTQLSIKEQAAFVIVCSEYKKNKAILEAIIADCNMEKDSSLSVKEGILKTVCCQILQELEMENKSELFYTVSEFAKLMDEETEIIIENVVECTANFIFWDALTKVKPGTVFIALASILGEVVGTSDRIEARHQVWAMDDLVDIVLRKYNNAQAVDNNTDMPYVYAVLVAKFKIIGLDSVLSVYSMDSTIYGDASTFKTDVEYEQKELKNSIKLLAAAREDYMQAKLVEID